MEYSFLVQCLRLRCPEIRGFGNTVYFSLAFLSVSLRKEIDKQLALLMKVGCLQ